MDGGEYAGFLAAARTSVRELHRVLGFDLWLVTCVDSEPRPPDVAALLASVGAPGEDGAAAQRAPAAETGPQAPAQTAQVVLAAAGPLSDLLTSGSRLPWESTFCRCMVAGDGPWFAPDVSAVPAYTTVADVVEGLGLGRVASYLGRPLHRADGSVLGTVCAYGRETVRSVPAGGDLASVQFEQVHLVAELLSSVVTAEERAAERARDAAEARELAEHDALTGLRNRRGWDRALALEQQRIGRYGHPASVVTLDLDRLEEANDVHGHAHGDVLLRRAADVLERTCRPSDVTARIGGDEFAVLAVEADALAARALAARIAHRLRVEGVPAGLGVATRRVGEDLAQTVVRADLALRQSKRRRRRS
jgi:diguanylate cyclase (GGDEF)-like protein